ncbi:uncharacterized protein LOC113322429 [Papaver somniferum]|uniref:uncharacterized protein LOC113322429 n=1 Tax=Papaver somniferum TaxID=3469 RepID=UPI000E704FAF|nr:uncharacterized protein LOC113322429 [Papaver somniferum]
MAITIMVMVHHYCLALSINYYYVQLVGYAVILLTVHWCFCTSLILLTNPLVPGHTLKVTYRNSCGVFAFKFIEHMVRKIPVCEVEPAFATRYRCELAVQLFKKQFIEVNGTSGE